MPGEPRQPGLFLELILPTIEEAGSTADPLWKRAGQLWGYFDVDAVYVARGLQWEPLAQAGRLDLHYRPTSTQWAEGDFFCIPSAAQFKKLTWLTPFALPGSPQPADRNRRRKKKRQAKRRQSRSGSIQIRSLAARMKTAGRRPLRECLINDGWKTSHLAQVFQPEFSQLEVRWTKMQEILG